ncbi:MAG TPA: amidohydrolase family protein [Vicinamibacterales bacterium]|nr:amidohydrolase family protein [Vicinamibacterales bacterium]
MAARLTAYVVTVIVAITFVAGLIVGAQRDDAGPVDVMVLNGHVYTPDGKKTTAEAIAIQGNKILRVGTTREIQRLRRAQTTVIDANGGTVLPGFIDVHARVLEADATGAVEASSTAPDRLSAIRTAAADAIRRGITSVQTTCRSAGELELYDELRRSGDLPVRVYAMLSATTELSGSELDALDELRQKYGDDPVFKTGAMQIAVDAVQNPVSFTQAALNRLVGELDKREWQIVMHTAGDRALAMALEAYSRAIAANAVPSHGRRHRIEHVGTYGPVDMTPFAKLGVVESGQPWPAVALDPVLGIHVAVNGTLPDDQMLQQPGPVEQMSLGDAVDAYTHRAAWGSFDEHRKGTIARDMLADVVVLSKDIFTLPRARLAETEVTVTIFDGKVVFQKPATETDN